MLTVIFINDKTGSEKIGNYNYSVRINGQVIGSGIVIGHDRSTGWTGLVADLAKKLRPDLMGVEKLEGNRYDIARKNAQRNRMSTHRLDAAFKDEVVRDIRRATKEFTTKRNPK